MGHVEAAVLPREHFDKALGLVGIASLQRHPRLVVDQTEFSKRGPVTLEQPDEILFASGFHAIGADDDLIVCFRHA